MPRNDYEQDRRASLPRPVVYGRFVSNHAIRRKRRSILWSLVIAVFLLSTLQLSRREHRPVHIKASHPLAPRMVPPDPYLLERPEPPHQLQQLEDRIPSQTSVSDDVRHTQTSITSSSSEIAKPSRPSSASSSQVDTLQSQARDSRHLHATSKSIASSSSRVSSKAIAVSSSVPTHVSSTSTPSITSSNAAQEEREIQQAFAAFMRAIAEQNASAAQEEGLDGDEMQDEEAEADIIYVDEDGMPMDDPYLEQQHQQQQPLQQPKLTPEEEEQQRHADWLAFMKWQASQEYVSPTATASPSSSISSSSSSKSTSSPQSPQAEPTILIPPPPKALVIGTPKAANISLLQNNLPSDWTLIHYKTDDPTAAYRIPANNGNEAMVYLTYIIDHYNALPEHIVFSHGEYRAWHQPEPLPWLLSALNLTALDEHGWLNLRCSLQPSCTPESSWVHTDNYSWWATLTRGLHQHLFKPEDAWYNYSSLPWVNGMPIPRSFASPCCGQFAVSRAAIRARPREFWVRAREPLIQPRWQWAPFMNDAIEAIDDSWHLGVGYERLWHYIFGKDSHFCLAEDYCRGVVYQGRIECDRYTTTWEDSRDYENITCKLH